MAGVEYVYQSCHSLGFAGGVAPATIPDGMERMAASSFCRRESTSSNALWESGGIGYFGFGWAVVNVSIRYGSKTSLVLDPAFEKSSSTPVTRLLTNSS